jgi:cholesterol oxidase
LNKEKTEIGQTLQEQFDIAVIGSGFGGSVAALRLSEKGYKVLVIEAGARFEDQDFAKNSFDLKKFLFFPKLGLKGIQRIDLLKNVLVMSGAGVGGGSLVYANTLYRPPKRFFQSGSWKDLTDWELALTPYYEQAERMLGVSTNNFMSPADEALKRVSDRMGFGESFQMAPVGIHFGDAGKEVEDPYFGGVGPRRTGCLNCGECMTGCRHGAKNTLVKNYLFLAESLGAKVMPLTKVVDIDEVDGGYQLTVTASDKVLSNRTKLFVPELIVAAGALGTAKLLHSVRSKGKLSGMSNRFGQLSRTNSESLLGVVAKTKTIDYSSGSAITSSVFPDADTHIEPVRYGKGSGFMGLLQSVLASGKNGKAPNLFRLIGATFKNFFKLPNFYNLRSWPERTLILLVMQSRDNSLTTFWKRRLSSKQGHGEPNPAWVPIGHEVAKEIAKEVDGTPGAVIGEPFGIPLTAHFLGGAVIGESAESAVLDGYLRAFGQPGLHIVDGSALSANPGVNPSLSITAIAEWAMAHWPNKGEADQRPELGQSFKLINPIAPKNPAVPKSAPAALRLPIRPA